MPITNPTLAFGYTSPQGSPAGWAVDTYAAGAVVSSGYLVAITQNTANGQAVIHAVTDVDTPRIVGVALDNANTNGTVRVVRWGPCTAKKGDANFAAGNYVTIDATTVGVVAALTAGAAVTQVKDLGKFVGVVLAAATTGATTVPIFVVRP